MSIAGPEMLSSAIVLAAGVPAIWTDLHAHRIPNALVGATLIGAFALQLGLNGVAGVGTAFSGMALGLFSLLPLYLKGLLGAGDVKLMAAFGALLGPMTTVLAIALTLIAGAGLGLAIVLWRLWSVAGCRFWVLVPVLAARDVAGGGFTDKMPYAGAIVAGTFIASLIGS